MKRIKKISIIFVLTITLLAISTNVLAATASASLSASKTTLEPGKTATVSVIISSGSTIRGAQFSATGNSNLTILSVSGASGFSVSSNGSNHQVFNLNGTALTSGRAIATITVKAGATNNTTGTLTVSGIGVSVIENAGELPKTVSAGTRTKDFTIKKTTVTPTTPTTPSEEKKSSDATLASLTSNVANIPFEKNKISYTVNVDKNVTSLNLKAAAQNTKANVKITGDEGFKIGNNTVTVTVTAEDGTTKTYTINVIKSRYGTGALTSLEAVGFDFNKTFDPSIFEYTLVIDGSHDDKSLELKYTTASDKSTVEIVGNKDFVVGNNVVKIIVKETDGKTSTYTINVLKEAAVEKGILDVKEKSNLIWLIIIIILLILVIVETTYIIIKRKKAKENN